MDKFYMTKEEIMEQKNWWYQKDSTYTINSDWINQYKEPAKYPAFLWWDEYKFKSLRLYFEIVLKKRTDEVINKSNIDMWKYKYAVTISGAISSVPLPLELWEESGDPWHHGIINTVDPFYFGKKYKDLEIEYRGETPGFSSGLINGFDNYDEAKKFMEMWKVKCIKDHEDIIGEDRVMLEEILRWK